MNALMKEETPAVQEARPMKPKRLTFLTDQIDYYKFGIQVIVEPGYWVVFSLQTGKYIFRWEYDLKRR